MLCRRNLVMLGLSQNTQLPELFIQVCHILLYPGLYVTKVMILQLLPLGWFCTKQGTAGVDQIFSFLIQVFID